ncbi:hypothetical protein [Kangiella sp.]|uniref:hypothetical protein n=1 Tax=Kangiella sp. TaxID=1920245 RepID=UPI003A8D611A
MNCKYHLHKKALWHCNHCDTPFCIDCCDVEPGMHSPRCLLCRNHMDSYGLSDHVEPFWNKLSLFNGYPFQKNAINFLGVFMVMAFVVGVINNFIPIWLINVILKLILFSVGITYVFSVLTKVARGNFEAPSYDEVNLNNSSNMTGKVIGLYLFLIGTGITITVTFGWIGLLSAWVALGFFLPAMMINLAMVRSIEAAINPADLLRTIVGIGWPYLLLVLFVYLIGIGQEFAQNTIYFWLPEFISYPLIYGALGFFHIMMFSMLGYVVYQYHAELGYGINAEQIMNNENVQQVEELRKLAHSDVYIQEGRFDDAEAVLYETAKNPQYSSLALERLIKLNMARNNPVATVKAARAYYDQKDLFKHAPKALALYQEIDSFEPLFKPMNANARAVLIGAIRNPKLLPVVEKLTTDMQEKLEQDPALAQALSAEAKFYAEVMNDDDKAIDLLEKLLAKFPHGSHKIEAERLLGICMNMKQSLKPNA